jgi:hypothetical protein
MSGSGRSRHFAATQNLGRFRRKADIDGRASMTLSDANDSLRASLLKFQETFSGNAQRHLVECCFLKLKQFRRVATHFEKSARIYRAVVKLTAIILWMRQVSTPPGLKRDEIWLNRHRALAF